MNSIYLRIDDIIANIIKFKIYTNDTSFNI